MGLTYRRPVVTLTLIAINVALWLATVIVGPGSWLEGLWMPDQSALMLLGAKEGAAIEAGQYWRLVTAIFLHGGALHLAMNMWALLQLGTLCELLYGRVRFLILYVCSGVLGTFASYQLSPYAGVGASGAIFGLLGVALVFSIKYRRELPPGTGDHMRRSLTTVLVLNLLITLAVPLIDKGAHLGGLIAGVLLAAITESIYAPAARREQEWLPTPLALVTTAMLLGYGAWGLAASLPQAVPVYAATLAARQGKVARATGLLRAVLAQRPEDVTARRAYYELLLSQKRWGEATREFFILASARMLPRDLMELGVPLAMQLTQNGQIDEAERIYRRLHDLNPDHFYALNALAYFYADVTETHLDEAEQMALRALEVPPSARSARGLLLRGHGFQDLALWYANRGATMDTLAWIYFKQGKLDLALATQQQALRHESDNPEMRYHMGRIYEARGDLPAARSEYGMALRKNPKYAPARRALEKLNRPTPAPQAPPPAPGAEAAGRDTRAPASPPGAIAPAAR